MKRSPSPAVETVGLVKTFGAHRALDGVDLCVRAGSVYGLLGPNGAGKTTTIRVLATLTRPDAGRATVFGRDVVREPDAVRRCVTLTGQFASVDQDLTGQENLVLLSRLLGYRRRAARARAEELLGAFGLSEAARRPVKSYSGGMRRRLDIAASMVVPPDLLFLDEPTTGLDPRSRNEVWSLVRGLVAAGTTVLLTTQYLDEADQLADRLAVIDRGAVIAEGTPAELKAAVGHASLRVRLADPGDRDKAARLLGIPAGTEPAGTPDSTTLSRRVLDSGAAAAALAQLIDAGIGVADFALGQASLDEVFLTLTGRATDGADITREEVA